MKTIAKALMLTSLITLPVYADSHNGNDNMPMSKMAPMSAEMMMGMNKQMEKIHETMQTIMNESDAEKRQALLNEHMTFMQEGMMMMNKNMGMGMGMGMGRNGAMDNRLHRMEQGMNMMQMMMTQMMEHQNQEMKKDDK
ncbi:MAG: protein CpxP [Oleispira sp.]|jgi:protein CpxP